LASEKKKLDSGFRRNDELYTCRYSFLVIPAKRLSTAELVKPGSSFFDVRKEEAGFRLSPE